MATGDEITRIEGVLSGTLSLLFDEFMPASGTSNVPWSSLVAHARDAGETEPDPRDDLNGLDFARKLTILARVVGLEIARPDSFPVESLIPTELASLPSSPEGIAQFMSHLPDYDARMEMIKYVDRKEGRVVRYIGSIDVPTRTIKVGLQHVEKSSPIANLKGGQIVSIRTKRYGASPLILQGGGGGGEITAMGLMADLLKVIQRLG